MKDPFRYFKTSPDIIRIAVMMYVRFPLSLRQVEEPLHERGIDISYETVRAWWNRFGPMFAAEIRNRRTASVRGLPQWRWHSTIGSKIPTSRFDDENTQWQISGAPSHFRSSFRSSLQSTIISIRNAISAIAKSSSCTEPPPLPSGASWQFEARCVCGLADHPTFL